jgi:hypothetical protein
LSARLGSRGIVLPKVFSGKWPVRALLLLAALALALHAMSLPVHLPAHHDNQAIAGENGEANSLCLVSSILPATATGIKAVTPMTGVQLTGPSMLANLPTLPHVPGVTPSPPLTPAMLQIFLC